MTQYNGNQNWMELNADVIGDLKLCELTIPGTHDSATCGLVLNNTLNPISEAAKTYSKAQVVSFEDQLNAGIRYFDLRVKHHKKVTYAPKENPAKAKEDKNPNLGFFHGMCDVALDILSVETMLKQVKQFLRNHTKEVIILHFAQLNHATTEYDCRKLLQLLATHLSDDAHPTDYLLLPPTLNGSGSMSGTSITLAEIWKTNKRVIVIWDSLYPDSKNVCEEHKSLLSTLWFGPSCIRGGWANTTDVAVLEKSLHDTITRDSNWDDRNPCNASFNGFLRLQAILTPQAPHVVMTETLSEFWPNTVPEPDFVKTVELLIKTAAETLNVLGKRVNPHVHEWLLTGFMKDSPAIVSVDFFNQVSPDSQSGHHFVDIVIANNRARALAQHMARTPILV